MLVRADDQGIAPSERVLIASLNVNTILGTNFKGAQSKRAGWVPAEVFLSYTPGLHGIKF